MSRQRLTNVSAKSYKAPLPFGVAAPFVVLGPIVQLRPMPTAYERRAIQRRIDNERRLMGETLATFHARETAKPPTLGEVYARNHVNRERCPWTVDLLAEVKRQDR